MTGRIALYDATVASFLQQAAQIARLLDKAEAYCAEHDRPASDMLEARLAPDMLPFSYQVKSVAVHSIGAIEGVRAGSFSPDFTPPPDSFAGLRERIAETIEALKQVDPAEVAGFVGRDMRFVAPGRTLDFAAQDFLLSFSVPNFYFHATTAYALLRAAGLSIGKIDFLGRPRVKA